MPFRGAKNLLKIGDEVTKPLQSGAKTIYQKGTLDTNSQEEFGEALTIFEANRRREQKSLKNKFTSDQKKAQDFFGTGDKADASLKEDARAAENERLTKQNLINNAAEGFKKAAEDRKPLEVQNFKVAVETQELVNTARAEIKAAKENLKTNVFTRHYQTGKELGVMTKRQRLAYEKEAGTKTFEGQMEKYGLDPNDPRRETKYTSKSWRNREDQKRKELLIKQQEQTNKQEIQIGNNNKETKE